MYGYQKEFLRFSETDNKILDIMLKHTLHAGPALVGFFGGFFCFCFSFFIFNPSAQTLPPPPHTHTLFEKNVLLGHAYFLSI